VWKFLKNLKCFFRLHADGPEVLGIIKMPLEIPEEVLKGIVISTKCKHCGAIRHYIDGVVATLKGDKIHYKLWVGKDYEVRCKGLDKTIKEQLDKRDIP